MGAWRLRAPGAGSLRAHVGRAGWGGTICAVDAPTADDIRQWSIVDFGSLGFADDALLGRLIERVTEAVELTTGRPLAGLPGEFDKQMEQVLQMLVEQGAYQAQPDQIETASEFFLISSFTAGSYSETRRGLEEIRKSGLLNPNPTIHFLLWALMTAAKRDEWLGWITGVNAPAFETTEVNWSAYQGASYLEGFPLELGSPGEYGPGAV